jgi:hypothetical protein
MWKIFVFIEKWLVYPVWITICFLIYYVFYVILIFKFPKISFIKAFKGEDDNFSMALSSVAHVFSGFSLCLSLAVIIFLITFAK